MLIVGGRIAARIDSHGGALYARTTDQRTATFHFALQAGVCSLTFPRPPRSQGSLLV